MRSASIALAIFLSAIALASSAIASSGDVVVLTAQNFYDIVDKEEAILVEFYAPWCGHCKSLEPEYNKAAAILSKDDPPIKIAKVDATVESSLGSRYGVTGYPTIKLFRKGEVAGDYDSGRDANSIVNYMRKQSGPSSRLLNTADEVKAFLAKNEVAVIGFFPSVGSMQAVFLQLADKHRDNFKFAHTTNSEALQGAGFTDGNNRVVLFHAAHFESKLEAPIVRQYDGPNTLVALENFVLDNAIPTVGHLNANSAARFNLKKSRASLPVITVFYAVDYAKNAKNTNYWRNRVLKVANAFEGKALFAIADKSEYASKVAEFGLPADREIVVGFEHEGRKYVMQSEFSIDNLQTFVSEFLAGNIKPHIKSQPEPTSPTDVTVVVGTTFDDIVMNSNKDVLIEFYAPWCGHCKNLEPIYNELGKKFKDEQNIVIAKIDATANDYPKVFPVQGYPSIFFLPANDKANPKKYSGERDLNSFVEYIKKEATLPLKAKKSKGDL